MCRWRGAEIATAKAEHHGGSGRVGHKVYAGGRRAGGAGVLRVLPRDGGDILAAGRQDEGGGPDHVAQRYGALAPGDEPSHPLHHHLLRLEKFILV